MLDFSHETRRAHVVRLFTSGAGCPDQYGGMVCGCASCLTRMLGASIVFTSLVRRGEGLCSGGEGGREEQC